MSKLTLRQMKLCLLQKGDILVNPTTNDRYKVRYLIQVGGFGSVYSGVIGKDQKKKVAIKCIPKFNIIPKIKVKETNEKIPSEVYFLQKLASVEGVLHLVDWWMDKDKLIIIMERPERFLDVNTYIGEMGPIREPEAKDIFRKVLKTVVNMSRAGVFHRDIKLDNVILSHEKGRQIPYVIDFGCATVYKEDEVHHKMVGTRALYPPEYHLPRGYKCQGHTVWNLGCFLFEIITGQYKFDGTGTPSSGFKYNISVSKDVRDLIDACLESDPDKRATFDDIAKHKWMKKKSYKKKNIIPQDFPKNKPTTDVPETKNQKLSSNNELIHDQVKDQGGYKSIQIKEVELELD